MQTEQLARFLETIRGLADPATGHPPTKARVFSQLGLSQGWFSRHFASYDEAVAAAGLTPFRRNRKIPLEVALTGYGEAARAAGCRPTRAIYALQGRTTGDALLRACGSWHNVPDCFRSFAADKPEWQDVLALLEATPSTGRPWQRVRAAKAQGAHTTARLGGMLLPVCGAPLNLPAMRQTPVNELGVVALFALLAERLGFAINHLQEPFQDCLAQRRIGSGKWRMVRIEFEYESANFVRHGHPVDGCDMIVCWRHTWAECPEELEVLELRRFVEEEIA